jgi:hypothetical protein
MRNLYNKLNMHTHRSQFIAMSAGLLILACVLAATR